MQEQFPENISGGCIDVAVRRRNAEAFPAAQRCRKTSAQTP